MRIRVVLVFILILVASQAGAGVWRVEQDGSGDFMVIQDAVDAAASGDTILIGPGRYDDLQVRGEMTSTSVVYWDDGRDLVFIGASADAVIIGPAAYEPVGAGPQGIHQHAQGPSVVVKNVSLENLQSCIVSAGRVLRVSGSSFDIGKNGVYAMYADSCIVRDCTFSYFDFFSVTSYSSTYSEVANCTLDNAVINFNDTANGIVRNCTVTGGSLVRYYLSSGLVEDCDAQCDGGVSCISVSDCDTVRFYDNKVLGGNINLDVSGSRTSVLADRNDFSWPTSGNFYIHSNASFYAHDNHINRSSILVDHVLFTSGYVDAFSPVIDVSSNYWFADGTIPGRLDELIHDGNDDPSLNIIVNYEPVRDEPVPTENPSFGGIKALFR